MIHPRSVPEGLDVSKPTPARIYDYMLGGHSYFDVDETAAKRIIRAVPEVEEVSKEESVRGYIQSFERAADAALEPSDATVYLDKLANRME